MSVKGNSLVNIQEQLSGDKGSAILTSSSSTEPSFYQDNYSLSTYTHFIVQGLKTGLADRDKDGWIDPNDLHGYLKEKFQSSSLQMTPQFFPTEEGYKIRLARSFKNAKFPENKVLMLHSDFKEPDRRKLEMKQDEIRHHLSSLPNPSQLVLTRPKSDFLEDVKLTIMTQHPHIIHVNGFSTNNYTFSIINELEEEIPDDSPFWQQFLKSISTFTECVFLDSFSSVKLAKKISYFINYVIHIDSTIGEVESIFFSRDFYAYFSCSRSIEDAFNQAKQKFPDAPIRLFKKTEILEKTIKINKYKLSRNPRSSQLLLALCSDSEALGDFHEAIRCYDQFLELIPHTKKAKYLGLKSIALQNIGKYSEALKACNEALQIEPQNSKLLKCKSDLCKHFKEFEEALLYLNKAIGAELENHYYWHDRGRLLEDLGRFESAIESYEKSLEINPNGNKAEKDRAELLKRINDDGNKNVFLEGENPKISSKNYEDWLTQAYISEFLGRDKDAEMAYLEALEISPDDSTIIHQLGDLFVRIGKHEEAITTYKRMLLKHPENYIVQTKLGLVLRGNGQIDESIQALKRALRINPAYRAAKYEQRWSYREKKS
jgi:tetratricopeptide (TPR) repeat protein